AEVNRFLVTVRRLEAETIRREAAARGIDLAPATPTAIAFLMYAATLVLARERATGVTEGRDEVLALFEWLLDRFA
ncbi:MAG: hypothetical protein N2423_10395, partial [Novosphingobium sp.]|nr:hypothetical protein [Novosphingobium sp.]